MAKFKLSLYVVDLAQFRAVLRGRREERGLTMLQLAKLAGVAPATVHKLESGKITVHLDKFLRIADALQLPLSDLISFDGSKLAEPPDPLAAKLAALVRANDQAGILRMLADRVEGSGDAKPQDAKSRKARGGAR